MELSEIEETIKFVEDFINDPEIIEQYDKINLVRGEGIEEGKYENSLETAKKLLTKRMSIKDIIEVTGLSKKQIEALK